MGWQIGEFGHAHDGRPIAVLADGSEPKSMTYDTGSAGSGHVSREWWVYDGTLGAPLAQYLRGGCACGWRGTALHSVDWAELGDEPYAAEPVGPRDDWQQHMYEVEARAVPVPSVLAELLRQLDEHLAALADDGPVAALRAVAALERTAARIGTDAAHNIDTDDEVSWELVGMSLGLPEQDARARVGRYLYAR